MRSDILAPGQNQLLLERAREFAQAVGDLAKAADDLCKLDEQIWPALRNSGLAMAPFGEAFGGAGLGEADKVVVLCKILRIFGAADLSVARLFEGHLNAILLVSRLATADQIG